MVQDLEMVREIHVLKRKIEIRLICKLQIKLLKFILIIKKKEY